MVDVITNSSSELFVVNSTIENLKKFVDEYFKTNEKMYSGEGGIVDVCSLESFIRDQIGIPKEDSTLFHSKEFEMERTIMKNKFPWIKNVPLENMVVIEIDQANWEFIDFMKNTFPNCNQLE